MSREKDGVNLPAITAFRLLAAKLKRLGRNNPILLKDCLHGVQSSGGADRLKPELQLSPDLALLQAGATTTPSTNSNAMTAATRRRMSGRSDGVMGCGFEGHGRKPSGIRSCPWGTSASG